MSNMVAHIFSPSAGEAEANGLLWVQGQPGLCSVFWANQVYGERPCLKTSKQTNKQNWIDDGEKIYTKALASFTLDSESLNVWLSKQEQFWRFLSPLLFSTILEMPARAIR